MALAALIALGQAPIPGFAQKEIPKTPDLPKKHESRKQKAEAKRQARRERNRKRRSDNA